MSFGITEKSTEFIIYALKQLREIESASIFGSRAIGNYKNGSDVDIVIYGQEVSGNTINQLRVLLNEELPIPYYFDIVHYESLNSDSLKLHIDKYSKLFYRK